EKWAGGGSGAGHTKSPNHPADCITVSTRHEPANFRSDQRSEGAGGPFPPTREVLPGYEILSCAQLRDGFRPRTDDGKPWTLDRPPGPKPSSRPPSSGKRPRRRSYLTRSTSASCTPTRRPSGSSARNGRRAPACVSATRSSRPAPPAPPTPPPPPG